MSPWSSDTPIESRQIDIIAWSPRSSSAPIDLTKHIREGLVWSIPSPNSCVADPLAFEVILQLASKQPKFRKATLELFAEAETVLLHIALQRVDEVFFGLPAQVAPDDLTIIDRDTVTFRVNSDEKARLKPYF